MWWPPLPGTVCWCEVYVILNDFQTETKQLTTFNQPTKMKFNIFEDYYSFSTLWVVCFVHNLKGAAHYHCSHAVAIALREKFHILYYY